MKKLFVCERPYMLYKSLLKAVANVDDTLDIVLSNHMPGMGRMRSSLEQSGLFERVFFFDDVLYQDYIRNESLVDYVKFPNILLAWPKKLKRYLDFHKESKTAELPKGLEWGNYDEICVIDGVSTINIRLNFDRVNYVVSEHCRNNFQFKMPLHQLAVRISIILDRLNVIVAYSGCSKYVSEIEVSSDKNLVGYLKNKKIRVFDVKEAENRLTASMKKKLFDIYARAFDMPTAIDGDSTLLLTTTLFEDGYADSHEQAAECFRRIVEKYEIPGSTLIVKPHPRDVLRYEELFAGCVVVNPLISAEVLAFAEDLHIKRAITTYSSTVQAFDGICECIKTGTDSQENNDMKYKEKKFANKLSVIYQSSEEFLPYAGVSLLSLLKNSRDIVDCVYIICRELSDENQDKLNQLSNSFHIPIECINSNKIEHFLEMNNVPRYKGSFAPYYKLFVVEYVDKGADRLLYIDADTVVMGSLNELLYYDFEDRVLAMAYDAIPLKHKNFIGLKGKKYFNSGVVYFDLKKWREQKCQNKVLSHINTVQNAYPVADQDLINVVFEGSIGTLEIRYNWTTLNEQFTFKNLCKIFQLKDEYYYSHAEVISGRERVAIYHALGYFGEQTWNSEGEHPFTPVWDSFLRQSPWRDYQKKATNRTYINKAQKLLYKILPSPLYDFLHRQAVNRTLKKRVF